MTEPVASALQVLWPPGRAGEVLRDDPFDSALRDLYAYPSPPPTAPPPPGDHGIPPPRWVRANMVATLDGAATGSDGRTGSINSVADRRVFGVLRGLADVVLAGAGTVRSEGYGLPRVRPELVAARASEGQWPSPALAVVTRSGNVPDTLLDGDTPAFVITVESAGASVLDHLRSRAGTDHVIIAGADDVDLSVALEALQNKGFRRVLCEGGPSLLADLVAAGELDDLCLTSTPVLTGGQAPRILDGPAVDQAFSLRHLLHSDGTLIARWVNKNSR